MALGKKAQKETKLLVILVMSLLSGTFLILTTGTPSWIADEIFAIILSIIFFSPLINAFFNLHVPREYIIFFIIGAMLFIVYICIYHLSLESIFSLLMKVMLFSSITSLGKWLVYTIAKTNPL
jgi:hypothetical protein